MTTSTPAAIEVRGVSVYYNDLNALDNVNLALPPSTVTGLVGMNGSGKSTLFKTIMGAIRPAAGTVTLHGLPPQQARRQGLVAYVPQSENVDWNFPICVRDVVMMGRYGHMNAFRRPRQEDHRLVLNALERVGLSDLADRQIGQLSGGQKKRAFVARAIAQGADIMLLDEPFAGVDKQSEATIIGLLRELVAEGRTIFISVHDLTTLPSLADAVVLLNRTVVYHGDDLNALAPDRLAEAFGMNTGASQ